MSELRDKVLLLTGASGMAAATAKLAAAAGARVFVVSLVAEQCAELAERLRARSGECEWRQADVSDTAQVDSAVADCVKRWGRIDAVFNVAGISGRSLGDGPVHECSDGGWDQTMRSNARSVFVVCRAVLRQMLAQAAGDDGMRGAILNMSSVLANSPQRDHFATHAYAASKAAIIGLSNSMAAYYAPHQIRVNVIAPALVRTQMSRRAQENADILRLMRTKQPLAQDLLEADDVARVAVFLLGPSSRMMTGTVVTVDGGWSVSG